MLAAFRGLGSRGMSRFKASDGQAASGPDVNVVIGAALAGLLIGFAIVLIYGPPPGTTVAVVLVSGLGATMLAVAVSVLRRY